MTNQAYQSCLWTTEVTVGITGKMFVQKSDIPPLPPPPGYRIEALTDVLPGPFAHWWTDYPRDDDDWPGSITGPTRCNQAFSLAPKGGATNPLTLLPLPDYVCDQAGFETWSQGKSLP